MVVTLQRSPSCRSTWSRSAVIFSTALLLAAGCVGRPWLVVQMAAPSPLLGQALVVDPVSFEGLIVGDRPEAAYQAGKSPEQQRSWEADKEAMARHFLESTFNDTRGLRIHPPPGPEGAFRVKPRLAHIEPGFYVGVAARPSEALLELQIVDAKGALVDEVRIPVSVPASLANPSSGGRLREAGAQLGQIAAMFLRERVTPER